MLYTPIWNEQSAAVHMRNHVAFCVNHVAFCMNHVAFYVIALIVDVASLSVLLPCFRNRHQAYHSIRCQEYQET